jgi:hypothetical protein
MELESKKLTPKNSHLCSENRCTLWLLIGVGVFAVFGIFETIVGSKRANAAQPIAKTPSEVKDSVQNLELNSILNYASTPVQFLDHQPKTDQTNSLTETENSNPMSQVTSVSQLSDVQPTDWAFSALQSLVERYGCIAGYPDQTYRGNRAIARYEFAAGLNACLDQVNRLIGSATANLVTKEDLAILQRLQAEFGAELATIRGRVDTLETRTLTLEKEQFSPTTKLQAFSIFIAADTFGDRANNTRVQDTKDHTQAFFAHFTRLSFVSSFTGKDALTTVFTSANVPLLSQTTGTSLTNFVTDTSPTGSNAFFLDRLNYRFPIGDRITVWLGMRSLQPFDFIPTINPIITSLDGPTGRFSWYNPAVYRLGFDGVGSGFAYKFGNQLQLHAAYLAAGGPSSDPAVGFFNANNGIISQLTFTPTPRFSAALTYAHKYFRPGTTSVPVNLFGSTGSLFALQPFEQNATAADNFGLQFNWLINSGLSLGGWLGYTKAHQLSKGDSAATIVNGALNLTFPDLFKKGNRGGIIVGIPPKVTSSNYRVRGVRREDPDTSLHLEVFYTHRLNDYISITPNIYVITKPEHNGNNDPIWVGVIRTNFTF